MLITQKQADVLVKYIPNINELAKSDDVQAVLDVIDDVIVENILAHGLEPDSEGVKIQLIYDQIFNQN